MRIAISMFGFAGLLAVAACDSDEEKVESSQAESSNPVPTPPKTPRPKGEFAVSMPCQMAVQLPYKRVHAPKPPQLIDQVATQNDLHKVMASASCSDFKSVGSTSEMLDIVSKGMITQLKGKEISRREIEWLERPGIEVVVEVPKADEPMGMTWGVKLDVRIRLVSQGLRLYQLMVMQSADNPDAEKVAATFFDSLELRGRPAKDAKQAWTTQTVGDFVVEAPGKPESPDDKAPNIIEDVRFAHATGRTGYVMRVWRDHLPKNDLSAGDHLQAFFVVQFTTDDIEILTTEETTVGEWPAVDVHYRPNYPVQEGVSDLGKKVIEERKLGYHVRLVDVGDRIVELRVNDRERDDRVKYFFDSLESSS